MRPALASLALTLLAAAAAAQDAPAPQPEEIAAARDYRAYVYGACTLVFACILVYLVVSHRRTSRVHEEMDHLDSRLGRLEEQTGVASESDLR